MLIAGAATEIAFEGVSNLGVAGGGIALDQLKAGHDHARGAKAALEAVFFPEALLHGMKFAEGSDSFDRDDIATVALDGEHGARFDGESIDGDGAGTTERGFATAVGTSEKEVIAEEVNKEKPGFDFSGLLASVDGNGDFVLQSERSFREKGQQISDLQRTGHQQYIPKHRRCNCSAASRLMGCLLRPDVD